MYCCPNRLMLRGSPGTAFCVDEEKKASRLKYKVEVPPMARFWAIMECMSPSGNGRRPSTGERDRESHQSRSLPSAPEIRASPRECQESLYRRCLNSSGIEQSRSQCAMNAIEGIVKTSTRTRSKSS